MQNSDVQCQTASATSTSAGESEKQRRKESRQKFLAGIRGKLASVSHQLAFSPAETGVVCGKSPTWAYRKIYDGTFKVINAEDGRLLIPRAEVERFLGGAGKYDPQPKAKTGGEHSLGSL
jgi:hypothetical protein